MRKLLMMSAAVVALAWPVLAQNAEAGKEYDITIDHEDGNEWVGAFGEAKVGSIVFWVPGAKADQKYHVKVTRIAKNQYTSAGQASCEFQLTGGNYAGKCIDAP